MRTSTKKSRDFGYDTEKHASSVISYIGGKHALIGNITPIIEYCGRSYGLTHYYEMCGGGARMLLNIPSTLFDYRSYNDMDLGLCQLFACLGDRDGVYALIAKLEELGFNEEVFFRAKHAREFESQIMARGHGHGLDRVTAAAYTFILALQSRAADMDTFDRARVSSAVRRDSYFKRVRRLDRFYPTLKDVEVTQGDCRELLDMYGWQSNSFAYLDPPYCPKTMVEEVTYAHSWTNEDHELLVDKLLTTNMKVALSGYDNDIYASLVNNGWKKLFLKNVHVSSSANGRRKNEFLWLNFDIPSSLEDKVCQFDYSNF
jgi:site-specific DNA-adenine methylase